MKNSWRKRILLGAFLALSALALSGQSCLPGIGGDNTPVSNINLVMWGLWEESGHLAGAIEAFKKSTGITVEYRKIASVADYEQQLLAALAENRGPDIFVAHHTWPASKRSLMSPAPSGVIDERALREEFVDVVPRDVLFDGQIWALPLSVDTLALYYNKDILSSNGVARPPRTWQEFQQVVERVTKVNRFGVLEQSGAALGTAANISRAGDIVQVLLLQSGMPISTKENPEISLNTPEGKTTLTFFTDYANKSKTVFTWDLQQDYSIDAFAEGDTAMMLHYSYVKDTIVSKNPRLRFGISSLPQIADSKKIDFAGYWPYAVSNRSANPDAAWQLLRFLTGPEQALNINRAASLPPARVDAVEALQRDPVLGVFADQAITATTWLRGNIVAVDAIFNNLIDSINTGAATIDIALSRAQDQLNQVRPNLAPPAAEQQDNGGVNSNVNIGF